MASRRPVAVDRSDKRIRIRLKQSQMGRWEAIKSKKGFKYDTELIEFLLDWYEGSVSSGKHDATNHKTDRKPVKAKTMLIKQEMFAGALMKCIHGLQNDKKSPALSSPVAVKSGPGKSVKTKSPKITPKAIKIKTEEVKIKKEDDAPVQRTCRVSLLRVQHKNDDHSTNETKAEVKEGVRGTRNTPVFEERSVRITRNRPSIEAVGQQSVKGIRKGVAKEGAVGTNLRHLRSKTAPDDSGVKQLRSQPKVNSDVSKTRDKPELEEVRARRTRSNSSADTELVPSSRRLRDTSPVSKTKHDVHTTKAVGKKGAQHVRSKSAPSVRPSRTLRSENTPVAGVRSTRRGATPGKVDERTTRSRDAQTPTGVARPRRQSQTPEPSRRNVDPSSATRGRSTGRGRGRPRLVKQESSEDEHTAQSSVSATRGGSTGRGKRGRPRIIKQDSKDDDASESTSAESDDNTAGPAVGSRGRGRSRGRGQPHHQLKASSKADADSTAGKSDDVTPKTAARNRRRGRPLKRVQGGDGPRKNSQNESRGGKADAVGSTSADVEQSTPPKKISYSFGFSDDESDDDSFTPSTDKHKSDETFGTARQQDHIGQVQGNTASAKTSTDGNKLESVTESTPVKGKRGRPRKTKLELRKIDDISDDEISLDMDVETINDDGDDTFSSGEIRIEKKTTKADVYDFESGDGEEEIDDSDDDDDDDSEIDDSKEEHFIKNLECTTRSGRQVKRSSRLTDIEDRSPKPKKKIKPKKAPAPKVDKKRLTLEERLKSPSKGLMKKTVSVGIRERKLKVSDIEPAESLLLSEDERKLEDEVASGLEATADGDAIIRIELGTVPTVETEDKKPNHVEKEDIGDSDHESVDSKSDTEADDELDFELQNATLPGKGRKRKADESDIQSDSGSEAKRKKTKSGLCTICGCFAGDIQRHSLMHAEKEKCGLCSFETNKLLTMQAHQIREHQKGEWKFLCEECDAGFMLMSRLVKHRNFHHLGLHVYDCDLCKKSFETANRLRVHKELVHIQKRYKCKFSDCSKTFKAMKHAEYHLRCHTGCKPYHCKLCSFTASQRNSMNWHMKKCHQQEPSSSNYVLDKSELQKLNVNDFLDISDMKEEEEAESELTEESFSSDMTSEDDVDENDSQVSDTAGKVAELESDVLSSAVNTSCDETEDVEKEKEKISVLVRPDSDEDVEMQVDLRSTESADQKLSSDDAELAPVVTSGVPSSEEASTVVDSVVSESAFADPCVGQSEEITESSLAPQEASSLSDAPWAYDPGEGELPSQTSAVQIEAQACLDSDLSAHRDQDDLPSESHIMENVVIEVGMKADAEAGEPAFHDGSISEPPGSPGNADKPTDYVTESTVSASAVDSETAALVDHEVVSENSGENINGSLLSSTLPDSLHSADDMQVDASSTEITSDSVIEDTSAQMSEYAALEGYSGDHALSQDGALVSTVVSTPSGLTEAPAGEIAMGPGSEFVVDSVADTSSSLATTGYEVPVCDNGVVMSQSVVGVSEYEGMETVTYVISSADGTQTVTAAPDIAVTTQGEVQVSEQQIYTTTDSSAPAIYQHGSEGTVYQDVAAQNIPLEASETVVYETYPGQDAAVEYAETTVYQDVAEQQCEEVVIEDNQLHANTIPVDQSVQQPIQQYVVGNENSSQLFTDPNISYVNISEMGNTHDNNNIPLAQDSMEAGVVPSMLVESEQVCEVVETEPQNLPTAPDNTGVATVSMTEMVAPESTVIQDSTLTSTTTAGRLMPQTVTFLPQSSATNAAREIVITNASGSTSTSAVTSPVSILRLPGQSLLKKQNYTTLASSLQRQSSGGRTVLTIPRVLQTVSSPRGSPPALGRTQNIRVPSVSTSRPTIVVSGSALSSSNMARVSPASRTQTVYLDANTSPAALSNSSLLQQRVGLTSGGAQMVVLDANRPQTYILPTGQQQLMVGEGQQTLAPATSSVVLPTTQPSNIITAYLDPSGKYWTTQGNKN